MELRSFCIFHSFVCTNYTAFLKFDHLKMIPNPKFFFSKIWDLYSTYMKFIHSEICWKPMSIYDRMTAQPYFQSLQVSRRKPMNDASNSLIYHARFIVSWNTRLPEYWFEVQKVCLKVHLVEKWHRIASLSNIFLIWRLFHLKQALIPGIMFPLNLPLFSWLYLCNYIFSVQ